MKKKIYCETRFNYKQILKILHQWDLNPGPLQYETSDLPLC